MERSKTRSSELASQIRSSRKSGGSTEHAASLQ
jgi:hypothetical protein